MTAPSSGPSSPLGSTDIALYIATVLIFGSSWLPLRMQLGVVAPEVSTVWRFLLASAIMLAVVAARGGRLAFSRRDHALFLALGATLFCVNFISFYHAGLHLPSGLMSVMFSLAAVFIPLIGAAVTRVPPSRRILAGAMLGVGGVALVFGPSLTHHAFSADLTISLMWALMGTLSFSLGSSAMMSAGRRGLPQASVTAFAMVYGLILCTLIALATRAEFKVEWTTRYLGALAYLALMPTVLGFAVYVALIRRIGPSRAGYGTVMFPVVALALSTVFEGYEWTLPAALGVGLVLVGNVVVLRAPRAAPEARR